VRALQPDRAPVLGSRSKGLGKMVREPQAWFYVSKWGVLCHYKTLQVGVVAGTPEWGIVATPSVTVVSCGISMPATGIGRGQNWRPDP
jgi:hypothetical protein